jgi:hypothetical protein
MKLYLLGKGTRIFSTQIRTKVTDITQTCLIGIPQKKIANDIYRQLYKNEPNLHILEIDNDCAQFTTMMCLNNLAMLVSEKCEIDADESTFVFQGSVLNYKIDIDNDHRLYLDTIYENSNMI